MISYELVKKLKDAKFPKPAFLRARSAMAYHPTLSELIAACGDNFISLQPGFTMGEIHSWVATGVVGGVIDPVMRVGDTMDDSVALLYLSINQTKKGPEAQ
jgi:hypothetical protein